MWRLQAQAYLPTLFLLLLQCPSCSGLPRSGNNDATSNVFSEAASGRAGHRFVTQDEVGRRSILEEESEDKNSYISHNPTGHSSCPCLTAEELQATRGSMEDLPPPSDPFEKRKAFVTGVSVSNKNSNAEDAADTKRNFNATTEYGVNCAPHDLYQPVCSNVEDCTTLIPLPADCDKSFCQRSFCFVDPQNCSLYHKASSLYPNVHYSYATCGHMDSFTFTERRKSLQDQTLQVAINSNTGGWMGAYHPEGSFATANQGAQWTGPMVEFLKDAATRGGFRLNITSPPIWLQHESAKFFGDSSFDACVYATSLGYLDLCIGAYTITDKRASVTPFFELGSDPVYLVTFSDDETGVSYQETLLRSVLTIFQPFTYGSWIMIAFICLPVLGALMLFHEYGTPGSAFPEEHEVVTTNTVTGVQKLEAKRIPFRQHVPKALYMSYLSFFNGSYDPVVVTLGGKVNLLAILSFVLLVLAVYTANLAAILTQDASQSPIDSLDEAIKANFNFCASRKVAERIIDLFGVDPDRIVSDPVALGGDGKAGFNCPDCGARERIFDFMKTKSATAASSSQALYCNAALASHEDLQVMHRYGMHCNKTVVGDILAFRDFGIPISSDKSAAVMSWLYEMKYEGVLDRHIRQAQPESQCPDNEGEEGIALNVEQLMGIWMVVFGFAFLGVLVSLLSPIFCRTRDQWAEQRLYRYDQWCNPVENPQAQEISKLLSKDPTGAAIGDTESDTDESVHCKVTTLRLRKVGFQDSHNGESLPM